MPLSTMFSSAFNLKFAMTMELQDGKDIKSSLQTIREQPSKNV